jgi:hypothetical protein
MELNASFPGFRHRFAVPVAAGRKDLHVDSLAQQELAQQA